jgi:hypothetical protein
MAVQMQQPPMVEQPYVLQQYPQQPQQQQQQQPPPQGHYPTPYMMQQQPPPVVDQAPYLAQPVMNPPPMVPQAPPSMEQNLSSFPGGGIYGAQPPLQPPMQQSYGGLSGPPSFGGAGLPQMPPPAPAADPSYPYASFGSQASSFTAAAPSMNGSVNFASDGMSYGAGAPVPKQEAPDFQVSAGSSMYGSMPSTDPWGGPPPSQQPPATAFSAPVSQFPSADGQFVVPQPHPSANFSHMPQPPPTENMYGTLPPQPSAVPFPSATQSSGTASHSITSYPPVTQHPTLDAQYGASAQPSISQSATLQPPPSIDPYQGALVPTFQQSNPYAQFVQQQQQQQEQQQQPQQLAVYGQPQQNPYALQPNLGGSAVYGALQQQVQPYGQPPTQQGTQPYVQPFPMAPPPVPQPPAPVDPFSVFKVDPSPVPPQLAFDSAPPPITGPTASTNSDDDFWGSFGPAAQAKEPVIETPIVVPVKEKRKDNGDLPPGGEWYDAKIFTPTLGVMFFKPQELTDSLFLNTDKSIVDGLGERPVVAFIVEGSSARSAGVELGHVLLKVNGLDAKNPKEASRLIKEGPRPLPLLFYVPNTDVVTAEGEHMVKYDTKETIAPNSAKDWKPKYVVIGGIIAQPWMMNMYRSKVQFHPPLTFALVP